MQREDRSDGGYRKWFTKQRLKNLRPLRRGPLQKTPSEDHPYYKAKGWTNRAYGATYNITQKGEDYYNGAFQSYPQDNQHSIWIEELLGNAPQTRGAFVDATNMLFNRGVTLQDHHTAELLAAEFYDRGYITYDEE
jgi:hypothetical protein